MKKLIAVLALLAAGQASAFWGWMDNNSSGYGSAANNGYADAAGSADAEADFSFDFNMTARFDVEGYGNGRGYGAGNGYGNGNNSYIPYYAAPYGYVPPAVR
ncbi:MAG: sulfur globule protein CV1 [Gammaproteobacteria bacterium]|nr:sulfur globule protein CV1 [Gammaproteobacteria bacterium]